MSKSQYARHILRWTLRQLSLFFCCHIIVYAAKLFPTLYLHTFSNTFSIRLFIISLFHLNIISSLFLHSFFILFLIFLYSSSIHSQQLYFLNLIMATFSKFPMVIFLKSLLLDLKGHIFQIVMFNINHIFQMIIHF